MKNFTNNKVFFIPTILILLFFTNCSKNQSRIIIEFNNNWKFLLGDDTSAYKYNYNDKHWRCLNLPHDWSIEGEFSEKNPAGVGGGALPGGIGWYRKEFKIPTSWQNSKIFIDFDGIYRNSSVWINGHFLGFRPYGYISFRYDLTPYIKFGEKNIIAVKVDNSQQPNSRWYSGSGIYRNVWLVKTNQLFVDQWGTFITTPEVDSTSASIVVKLKLRNEANKSKKVNVENIIINNKGNVLISNLTKNVKIDKESSIELTDKFIISNPELWSVSNPVLYTIITNVYENNKKIDEYKTPFGIRFFWFDKDSGFYLNGKPMKILGVCNHHDLGCLGAAINTRAIERQLEILKEMGCNAIRTSHNPPAPELLDLCDKMGFLVMDEAFDIWKISKTKYDYSLYWNEWYEKDLTDMILRDRNHPSIIIWSIGNEVMEQWDTSGIYWTKKLVSIVKSLDTTRPVTAACNPPSFIFNNVTKANALDLIGYNYAHKEWEKFHELFPECKFIATETNSALATRGHYDMPSDSIRRWPKRWDLPFNEGNPDNTVSSYDNVSAPWGSTHTETWQLIKKYKFLSGMFIWTGFDYLGEPTPYSWPSRSSYFGIIDLAGFPKDAYYFYKSEWTDKPVLHIFPHWNWQEGQIIDVWAYTNCDEVELFLNDKSLGTKHKNGIDTFHIMWRIKYEPGTLKAIGKKQGKIILTKEIKTADKPAKIILEPDRNIIKADGKDLSFVTVKITDKEGNLVPYADNLIKFEVKGSGFIVGVDNGSQTSHEPFKASQRKAFNGMCLVVIQSNGKKGKITLKATSEKLQPQSIILTTK